MREGFAYLKLTASLRLDRLPSIILGAVLGVPEFCLRHKTLTVFTAYCTQLTIRDNMTSLTAKDKETVKAFWAKVSSKAEDIGKDALGR